MKLRDLVAKGMDSATAVSEAVDPAKTTAVLRDNASLPAASGVSKWLVVNSRALAGEQVLVVSDKKNLKEARRAHPGLVAYFHEEVDELNRYRGRPGFPELLNTVHAVKREFAGWIVPSDSPLARQYEWPATRPANSTNGGEADGGAGDPAN